MKKVMAVTIAGPESSLTPALDDLVGDHVASRIAARDATIWGPAAEAEARRRLAWVDLAASSRPLVATIEQLRADFRARGLDRVVLCGMGGSSLGPEVVCAAAGVDLTVVDSSDPGQVAAALAGDLAHTVVVVSSKSGGTLETDSQHRAFRRAMREAGLDPRDHVVVVTDPGTVLDAEARAAGYVVINGNPDVGGRFSVLSAYGLVPSGLAGADISALLDEAAAVSGRLGSDDAANPGLQLGALLGVAAVNGVDKLVLDEDLSGAPGFGDWAEQLIAESTGKDGRGLLPVVVPSPRRSDDPATPLTPPGPDALIVSGGPVPLRTTSGLAAAIQAPLGAAFLLWEYAVSIAGRVIGINPFDQPDVESAKQASRALLEDRGASPEAAFRDGAIEVHATRGLLDGTQEARAAVAALLAQVDPAHGYLAVMAYLDRVAHADLAAVRDSLATRLGRPVTFGWGPRFLHSTGQFHKGGAPVGVFLQITATPVTDVEIPDRPFTFGQYIQAQAAGDAVVLGEHGRPVLRLHLTDLDAGLEQLRSILG
ncbi:glucose-6-phosphate isomerase [Nocardioides jiangxiensis]|uniref:Glucose-6-phosphate isomerase n=1 Tax=Nocardioides jiangxiensis TaxID=3064524 RepID=A0ABT9B0K3_9ACTN|nr:glucose-6-phosphate isomerase [Nocardioides sp. WY-20]MDO7868386.1 glucose-6-phosphate isomerase [Nocardioides sp. WY-20]